MARKRDRSWSEFFRSLLMIAGLITLLVTFFPLLNPTQYHLITGEEGAPVLRYIFGAPVGIAMITTAMISNNRALRRD